MITKGKCFDLYSKSPNLFLKKCMEISMEILYVAIGA